jgi:hypothetical protein
MVALSRCIPGTVPPYGDCSMCDRPRQPPSALPCITSFAVARCHHAQDYDESKRRSSRGTPWRAPNDTSTIVVLRIGEKSTLSWPVYWTNQAINAYPQDLETRAVLQQRVQHERTLKTRLHLATPRLADAERERIWAIVAAHAAGWSLRKIAAATGLSRSRIHQLLHEDDARRFPRG